MANYNMEVRDVDKSLFDIKQNKIINDNVLSINSHRDKKSGVKS
jgi:hypothetical protein